MKNNFRIINALRRIFYVFYWLVVANLVVGTLMNIMGLIFPDFPMADLSHFYFISEAKFSADISYKLLGGGVFNGESEVFMRFSEIMSDKFSYRLLSFIDTTLVMTILFFLFKNAHELFDNLTNSFKLGNGFSQKSYKNIRQIGFSLLVLWIYKILNGILFSWFLVKDLVVQGAEIKFYPDLLEFSSLIVVLVIFAFAEIYRAGVGMQEESELTI